MKTWRPLLAMMGLLAVAACSRGCGSGATDDASPAAGGAPGSAGIGGLPSGGAGIAGTAKGGAGQVQGGASGAAGHGGIALPLGGMAAGGKAGSAGAPLGFGGATNGEGVPNGWKVYTGWSEGCPAYYPPTDELLPEPIKWEPCAGNIPASYNCRELKRDVTPAWDGLSSGATITRNPANGAPVLQMLRFRRDGPAINWLMLAGEVDGPVLASLAQHAPNGIKGCVPKISPVGDGYWVFRFLGESLNAGSPREKAGALVGKLGSSVPTHVFRKEGLKEEDVAPEWFPTAPAVMEGQYGIYGIDWDTNERFRVYHADDPNSLPANRVFFWGDQVFVDVGGLEMHGVYVWDKKAGTRPLLRWVDDFTRGAAHFATDGKDMVWTLMERDTPGGETWTKMSVMTAPYTLDRDELLAKARRVTTDEKPQEPTSWQVGCGYAARQTSTAQYGNSLFVVRLSDGNWWRVSPTQWDNNPQFYRSLYVSCDEVFVETTTPTRVTITRIRLDSLGPPNPPN